jgi:hypothetical protein
MLGRASLAAWRSTMMAFPFVALPARHALKERRKGDRSRSVNDMVMAGGRSQGSVQYQVAAFERGHERQTSATHVRRMKT